MDISLDTMIKWFKANNNNFVFSNERKALNTSLRYLEHHKSYINSVVHCHQIIKVESYSPLKMIHISLLSFWLRI